jgi:para-nitrobenzyl esterase
LHDGTLNIIPTILSTPTLDDLPDAFARSLLGEADEFRQVVRRYRELRPELPRSELLKVGVTYGKFRHPFTEFLDGWTRRYRSPVYRYQFDWESPVAGGLIGSCHSVDLPFWFGHTNSPMVGDEPPPGLATTMATALGAFARAGAPTCSQLPDWPEYEGVNRSTMVLGPDPRVAGQDLYEEQVIWDEFNQSIDREAVGT